MNKTMIDYISRLKPQAHPDGREILKEGVAIGNTLTAGRSRFIVEGGKYRTHMDYKKDLARQGKIYWNILLGLATLEDQIEGIQKFHQFVERTGMEVSCIQQIPSGLVALPPEYRDKAPQTTSFVINGSEDYQAIVAAAPFEITFNDYHLVSPNALASTIDALKAGSPRIGDFTQFFWGYPGFNDDLGRFIDVVKAVGIMASKHDEDFACETYLDDGFPAYFLDCSSYVGYAMLEHYIVTKLCGARYVISFGGLLSEGETRMAVAMALDKALSTPEWPVLTYINSSTNLQWDHDIHGNYGVSCQEFLFEILVERKYRMCMGINPVSITEKIKVATVDDLLNILAAGKRCEEMAPYWEKFIDFTRLEEMRDVMVEQGQIFFNNVLAGFKAAGIDIEDPLEMLLALKKFNPVKFEQAFHSTSTDDDSGEVKPFYPTVMGRQTVNQRNEFVEKLKMKGLQGSLKGKKIVVGSGDCHTYGLVLVEGVLHEMGATTINAGVDVDPIDILDLADEENTKFVGISCHNGQALDYGRQILQLAKERGKEYWIFMGGKLNAILPGHAEPTEIGDMLLDLGIHAENDIIMTVEQIKQLPA